MKVVYDTCLYGDFLRSSKHLEIFRSRHHIRFLSPLVAMELRAGALSSKNQKIVQRLIIPYSKAHRIISLDANHYYRAGEILAQLRRTGLTLGLGFTHDVLIAISAFSIGATLFTSNKSDFSKIKARIPFLKIEFV